MSVGLEKGSNLYMPGD